MKKCWPLPAKMPWIMLHQNILNTLELLPLACISHSFTNCNHWPWPNADLSETCNYSLLLDIWQPLPPAMSPSLPCTQPSKSQSKISTSITPCAVVGSPSTIDMNPVSHHTLEQPLNIAMQMTICNLVHHCAIRSAAATQSTSIPPLPTFSPSTITTAAIVFSPFPVACQAMANVTPTSQANTTSL